MKTKNHHIKNRLKRKVRAFCFLVFLFLISQKVNSQQGYIFKGKFDRTVADSLIKVLKKNDSDSNKVKIYKQLTWIYRGVNMDTALLFVDKGIDLAKKSGLKKEQVDLIRFKGLTYYIHLYYKLAHDFNLESLELAKKIGYKEGEGFAYDRMGMMNLQEKEFEKATKHFENALCIFEELDHHDGIAYAKSHLTLAYIETGNYLKAIPIAKSVITIRQNQNNVSEIPNSIFTLGRIYHMAGNDSLAKSLVFSALTIAEKSGLESFMAEYYRFLSRVHQSEGSRDSAVFYALKSLGISDALKFGEMREMNLSILYELYKEKGDYRNAQLYLKKFNAVRDSLIAVEQKRNDYQYEVRFALNKEQLEFEQQQNKRGVVLAIVIFVLIVIALILYIGRRRLNKANKIMAANNLEIELQKREIEAHAAELEEMNSVKNKLFSIVSNDISEPLILASSFLERLKNDSISAEDFNGILPDINNHLKNTSSLLNNLLLWAKGQMSGNVLNKSAFNLSELLQTNVDYILSFAKTKGIQITCILNQGNLVFADRALVDIVCRNLLACAVKFCNSGDSIKVSTQHSGNFVKVKISDTGTGISEERVNDIFKGRFLTVEGTSIEAGWGLGLMLCKEFVEKNGGEIEVESSKEAGTTFYFTIPTDGFSKQAKGTVHSPEFAF